MTGLPERAAGTLTRSRAHAAEAAASAASAAAALAGRAGDDAAAWSADAVVDQLLHAAALAIELGAADELRAGRPLTIDRILLHHYLQSRRRHDPDSVPDAATP